jgi:hypothetical protein
MLYRICTLSSREFFFYFLGYYCFFLPNNQSNIKRLYYLYIKYSFSLICINITSTVNLSSPTSSMLSHAYDIHSALSSSSINLSSLSTNQSLCQSDQSLQLYVFVLATMLQPMFVKSTISSDMTETNSYIN